MFATRRQFMLSSGTLAASASLPKYALAATNPNLRAVLDTIANSALSDNPETLSSLGLDSGVRSTQRARLNDRSPAGRARKEANISRFQGMLARVRRSSLNSQDQVLYDSVAYELANGAAGRRFAYGTIDTFGGGNPYVISQQDGAYQSVPEFLDSIHRIETRSDAEAYLSRLSALGRVLDQETARVRHDAALGVVAPNFILDTALAQMRGLRAVSPTSARMVQSLSRRTADKSIPGDWSRRASRIVETIVYPALDRQIAAVAAISRRATHDAGVWKLPQGDAYYAWLLQYSTSTDLSPATIHAMGIEQGRDLDSRMDAVLRSQGMTSGTVGERLAALTKDPRQLFANTDEGKAQAVNYVEGRMNALRAMMPRVSKMEMQANVMVKRVPQDIESGAALGYMNFASLDGVRPAIYYINLKDTANWPKYTIPSLSAHEGLPGHSWQGAYVAEHRDDVPLISSLMGFNAYTEGWALYSEQLVDELGFYKDDPFGQIGMYQALRFRASRLVVDTGLHSTRWSREKAIDYLASSTGRARTACTSEIDRYCASPGQACGYKVGHTEIVRLRSKAIAALGPKFDVRDFNDMVIQTGSVPLPVLATATDNYIARMRS